MDSARLRGGEPGSDTVPLPVLDGGRCRERTPCTYIVSHGSRQAWEGSVRRDAWSAKRLSQ